MSTFLNQSVAALSINGGCYASDDRAVVSAMNYQWFFAAMTRFQQTWQDGYLWSRSIGVGGQFSSYGYLNDDAGIAVTHWEPSLYNYWDDDGGAKQNIFTGTSRDQYGNALGSCVVSGYVTGATPIFVGSVTSDASGYYRLPTPYSTSTAHFLVAFKSGSPDVGGTTDNTLVPSASG